MLSINVYNVQLTLSRLFPHTQIYSRFFFYIFAISQLTLEESNQNNPGFGMFALTVDSGEYLSNRFLATLKPTLTLGLVGRHARQHSLHGCSTFNCDWLG